MTCGLPSRREAALGATGDANVSGSRGVISAAGDAPGSARVSCMLRPPARGGDGGASGGGGGVGGGRGRKRTYVLVASSTLLTQILATTSNLMLVEGL